MKAFGIALAINCASPGRYTNASRVKLEAHNHARNIRETRHSEIPNSHFEVNFFLGPYRASPLNFLLHH